MDDQVFMNLPVNAAEAIEQHGTIAVRTGRERNEVTRNVAQMAQDLRQVVGRFGV